LGTKDVRRDAEPELSWRFRLRARKSPRKYADLSLQGCLISLNGEAREVIRDNQNLTCIWPSSRKVVVDFSRKNSFSPIFIPEDIARLEKFYVMKLLGKDRVANMNAVVVHIDPRDKYRYGMKFWINEDNGLMMKSSLINENQFGIV
jgi:sigma-E factor negative regulatory protein RseB